MNNIFNLDRNKLGSRCAQKMSTALFVLIIKRRMVSFFTSLVLVFGLAMPATTFADTIAMIGTGSVGSALGPRFASIGHQIVYGSRSPDSEKVMALVEATGNGASATTPAAAARQADIVVLALPWAVAEEVTIGLGDLSGKIIIDPINPRIIDDEGWADYPTYTSNTERIQILAPNAMVVKAFSTISVDTMIDPTLVDHPLTIPLVGNDSDAKQVVAEICEALGFETIDFGPVRYAHVLEGLYLLRINARLYDNYFEWNYSTSKRTK
jgi:predicted dinucleotide-binding enzyme